MSLQKRIAQSIRKPQYTERVDKHIYNIKDGCQTPEDWIELVIAAMDQGGYNQRAQDEVRDILESGRRSYRANANSGSETRNAQREEPQRQDYVARMREAYQSLPFDDRQILRRFASGRLVAQGAEEVGSSDITAELVTIFQDFHGFDRALAAAQEWLDSQD